MGQHKETSAEILGAWKGQGHCDITCRLCGVRLADDKPDSIWQGFKPGLGHSGFSVDEHEKCDVIAKEMEKPTFSGELDALFDRLGIDRGEPERTRRVLMFALGHRWVR